MNVQVKKIIWILLGLVIGGYIINSYFVNKAVNDAKKADIIVKEQVIKGAINELVFSVGAIDNWEESLGKGEAYRLEPIMTVELENLWLQGKPILFIGSIKDIATYNDTFYTLTVDRGLLNRSDFEFSTDLQLSLSSPKQKIDTLLELHPDLIKRSGFDNNIAVVAQVKNIQSKPISGEEEAHQEVKIGVGELIDILYIGDI